MLILANSPKLHFFQLRRIAKLSSFLNPKDAESLVNEFIISRLDYCNALYSGLQARSISRLQYIQNCCKNVNVHHTLISLLFFLTSTGYLCPLISFIQLFCLYSLHGLAATCLSDLMFSIYSFSSTSMIWRGTSLCSKISPFIYGREICLCYGSYMIELIAPVSPVNNHTARIQTQIESVQPTLSVIICFFLNCLGKALYKFNLLLLA